MKLTRIGATFSMPVACSESGEAAGGRRHHEAAVVTERSGG